MQQPDSTLCSEEKLLAWDEVDRLMEQLKSMISLLQCAQIPSPGASVLPAYTQVMEDMLTQVDQLHRTLRRDTPCGPYRKTHAEEEFDKDKRAQQEGKAESGNHL